jgi:superfamily II DNA or RNA helicase
MLFDQLNETLIAHNIDAGLRASGHKTATLRDVQLAMIQTESLRIKRGSDPHPAKLVIIDEAHVNGGGTMQEIVRQHVEQGAFVVGYTATPLGIGHFYDELLVAGTTREMFRCGALVEAEHYGPDEPDLRHVKKYRIGEDIPEHVQRKAMMRDGIFGRVEKSYRVLNESQRPGILFSSGVPESIWFSEQLNNAGITAAHIDGKNVVVDGKQYPTSKELRDEILERSKAGDIKVICNRFVLREGIDAPWLEHAIFACIFGALTSYLQAGGRLLRQYFIDGIPQLERVTIQDHGGAWWRHGSLNADREWNLEYTNAIASSLRELKLREKRDPEPITCPQCFAIRLSGPTCSKCGLTHTTRSRMVVQVDGSLKPMRGDIFKPRRTQQRDNTQELWNSCYFGARKSDRTFAAAEAWFFQQHKYWPPHTLGNMPTNDLDWFLSAKAVPRTRLIPENPRRRIDQSRIDEANRQLSFL